MSYQASKNSPILLNVLTAVAKNPRIARNKLKNEFQITSGMMTALNTLLFCRNQNCNSIAMLVSLILRRGQADKLCFTRLSSMFLCVSYPSMITKQEQLGANFMDPVNKLIESSNENVKSLTKYLKNIDKVEDKIAVIKNDFSSMNLNEGNLN